MRNILIIGDSHLFRLIDVFEKSGYIKDWNINFIVGIGPIIEMLHFDNGKLKLDVNTGNWRVNEFVKREQFERWYQDVETRLDNFKENELNINHYDCIVVYGGKVVNNYWYTYQNNYSGQLNIEIMLEKLKPTQHYRLVCEIREANKKIDIISIQTPLINESGFEYKGLTNSDLTSLSSMPLDANFSKVTKTYTAALKIIGSDFMPLPEIIFNSKNNATSKKYQRSGTTDFNHLNSHGVKEVLNELIRKLSLTN